MFDAARKSRARIALLDIPGERLSDLRILQDAGLKFLGSGIGIGPEMVRLIVEGDALPEECAHGELRTVRIILEQIAYGSQLLTRVQKIELAA
jgi:hypothetical protein